MTEIATKHFTLGQSERIVVASVTTSTITPTIFFIVGLLCGLCCQEQKQIIKEQIPFQHDRSVVVQHSNDRELGLQENVSYASVQ